MEEFEGVKVLSFDSSNMGSGRAKVHLFYVDGLLIDTGNSANSKEVINEVRKLDVEQIFVTHHHEDHTGNLREVVDICNVEAMASLGCCEIMKSPPPLCFAQKLFWGNRPSYSTLIPVEEVRTHKYSFKLISMKGHADDLVGLYEPNKKWLFAADLHVNSFIGYMLDTESISDQIKTIKSVLELEFETLFCSHNSKVVVPREKLEKKLRYFEKFFNDVAALHKKGLSPEEIFNAMDLVEFRTVKFLSGGRLSRLNMVRSVIRDL